MNARTNDLVESPLAADDAATRNVLEPQDHSPAELGRRIKMLRVERDLTLKDLEQKGGISATHVSEIERGKASPTVGALGKIAFALGMRPAEILEPRIAPEASVLRAHERTAPPIVWGGATLVPLTTPTQVSQMSLHQMTLPIAREAVLSHRHPGEEWVTLLSGVAEVRIDDKPYVLREGDALHFRAHRPHAYLNLGSSPAVLLVACRPQLAL